MALPKASTVACATHCSMRPLFLNIDHARVEIAAWVGDYNHERTHSALGYEIPAAFSAELREQWPATLRPEGSVTQAIAQSAHIGEKPPRLQCLLVENQGGTSIGFDSCVVLVRVR
jgi:hypothetical protein